MGHGNERGKQRTLMHRARRRLCAMSRLQAPAPASSSSAPPLRCVRVPIEP